MNLYFTFSFLVFSLLINSCAEKGTTLKHAEGHFFSVLCNDTTILNDLKENKSPFLLTEKYPNILIYEKLNILKQTAHLNGGIDQRVEFKLYPAIQFGAEYLSFDYQDNKFYENLKGKNIFSVRKEKTYFVVSGIHFTSDFKLKKIPESINSLRTEYLKIDSICKKLFYYFENYEEYDRNTTVESTPIRHFFSYLESYINKIRPQEWTNEVAYNNFNLKYNYITDSLCSYDNKYYRLLEDAIEFAIKNKIYDRQLTELSTKMSKKDALILRTFLYPVNPKEEYFVNESIEIFSLASELKDTFIMRQSALAIFLAEAGGAYIDSSLTLIKKRAIAYLHNAGYDLPKIISGSIFQSSRDSILQFPIFEPLTSFLTYDTILLQGIYKQLQFNVSQYVDNFNLYLIINYIDYIYSDIKDKKNFKENFQN